MSDEEKRNSLTRLKKLGKVEEKRMKDLEENNGDDFWFTRN